MCNNYNQNSSVLNSELSSNESEDSRDILLEHQDQMIKNLYKRINFQDNFIKNLEEVLDKRFEFITNQKSLLKKQKEVISKLEDKIKLNKHNTNSPLFRI